jgi:hypothetical protein
MAIAWKCGPESPCPSQKESCEPGLMNEYFTNTVTERPEMRRWDINLMILVQKTRINESYTIFYEGALKRAPRTHRAFT